MRNFDYDEILDQLKQELLDFRQLIKSLIRQEGQEGELTNYPCVTDGQVHKFKELVRQIGKTFYLDAKKYLERSPYDDLTAPKVFLNSCHNEFFHVKVKFPSVPEKESWLAIYQRTKIDEDLRHLNNSLQSLTDVASIDRIIGNCIFYITQVKNKFAFLDFAQFACQTTKVIPPGIKNLPLETLLSYFNEKMRDSNHTISTPNLFYQSSFQQLDPLIDQWIKTKDEIIIFNYEPETPRGQS